MGNRKVRKASKAGTFFWGVVEEGLMMSATLRHTVPASAGCIEDYYAEDN
jgi:hypothetical protein